MAPPVRGAREGGSPGDRRFETLATRVSLHSDGQVIEGDPPAPRGPGPIQPRTRDNASHRTQAPRDLPYGLEARPEMLALASGGPGVAKPARVIFKVAQDPAEFEQVHRLNYRTFVEEIPQHPPNAEGRLVDRFHADNTYVVAVVEGAVRGMVALRGTRPFSLDQKLPHLDGYLPQGRSLC